MEVIVAFTVAFDITLMIFYIIDSLFDEKGIYKDYFLDKKTGVLVFIVCTILFHIPIFLFWLAKNLYKDWIKQ